MKSFRHRRQQYVYRIRCDRCGVEAQHDLDEGFNNFVQIDFVSGWGSELGDGTHVEVDLCHRCLKEALGPYLRTSHSKPALP
jgi:hypothetical protein